MTNLPAQRLTSVQEISILTERLSPIDDANVADAMKSLLASGLMLPAAINPEQAPAVYAFALKGVSGHALKRIVAKLIRGEFDVHKAFIPLPPELSVLARAETQRIADELARVRSIAEAREARDRRPGITYARAPVGNDNRIKQRIRAEELESQGYVLISNSCRSHDDFAKMGRRREVPVGSIHLWALDEVWAPGSQPVTQAEDFVEEHYDAA